MAVRRAECPMADKLAVHPNTERLLAGGTAGHHQDPRDFFARAAGAASVEAFAESWDR